MSFKHLIFAGFTLSSKVHSVMMFSDLEVSIVTKMKKMSTAVKKNNHVFYHECVDCMTSEMSL